MKHSKISAWLVAATLSIPTVGFAQTASGFAPEKPECIAPANAGGGWDFTCRQTGQVLYELGLIEAQMRVINRAGGGGGVAFAEVVASQNDNNELIIAASSATTTRLAQGSYPDGDMDQVRWIGTLGADYGVIAVAADSPYTTLVELLDAVSADPSSISFGGGSAQGGWDHLKLLIAAQEAGIEDLRSVRYVAFEGGGEAVTQILGGHIQAFSGDISEARGFSESGDIKILAVLSEERLPGAGFDQFPTAIEQGINAVGANWRGFYAPGGMSEEAYDYWVEAISGLYASDEWKAVMAANGLMPLDRSGADFEAFVRAQIQSTETLSREIGLIQ